MNNLSARNVFLSLFFMFGLLILVGFSIEAIAHESQGYTHDGEYIHAENVGINNEEDMKELLSHVLLHFNLIQNDDLEFPEKSERLSIIGRRFREEGRFKHEASNVYTWGINERGFITSHPVYPNLFGNEFNRDAEGSQVSDTLKRLIDNSKLVTSSSTINSDDLHCERYQYGGQDRVACAAKVNSPVGTVTSIVGLHHERNDSAIVPPPCDDFELETSAKDVYDNPTDANLKAYVKGIISKTQELTQEINTEIQTDIPVLARLLAEAGLTQADLANLLSQNLADVDPVKLRMFTESVSREFGVRSFSRTYCFSTGDFKHKNIYPFILYVQSEDLVVFLNGNNFDLNGAVSDLDDDELQVDDKSTATLFRNALLGDETEYRVGQSAFVSYRWDDPETEEDNVENWLENGKVPGTSPKRTYIEVASVTEASSIAPQVLAVFGSGIYNPKVSEEITSKDDDGCAIAGTGHTSQSALLSLFLIASVLFSAIFLRKRA